VAQAPPGLDAGPDLSDLRRVKPAILTPLSLSLLVGLCAAQDPAPPAQPGGNFADPSQDAFKYGSPPALPAGLTEEAMWPAASAEGWQMPVLVKWQRTFEDALLAARERNAPVMVAVNMDGEIASEHFAGVRYRDPETTALLNRYVCVIASVYRHTPRDYDETGARVVCPRFGTVTCGEHIEKERELYEKYFDGKRISPRHIMLDLDGKEQYDVYFSWDTQTVFTAYREGVKDWPLPNLRTDRTLAELTQSADIENRERVERLYVEGTRDTKRKLLEAVLDAPKVDQLELLRMAVFGLDLELAKLGRRALAQCRTDGAVELMAEVLKGPLAAEEREMLVEAARRLSAGSHQARTLVTLHEGLSTGSALVDTGALVRAREADSRTQYDARARRARSVDAVDASTRAVEARPADPAALLTLAESYLQRGAAPGIDPKMARLLYEDARRTAQEAAAAGASGGRLEAVLAIAAAELGDIGAARMHAFSAVEAGVLATEGPEAGTALTERGRVRLLLAFAEARQAAIRARYRARAEWPGTWLSDVHAAYAAAAGHELVGAGVLTDYYDFLRWIGAVERANAVLDDALARFPDDAVLHDRLRARLLWEVGPDGLERVYAARVTQDGLHWYAGYASLVAAEYRRRRGEFDSALLSYERAVEHYSRQAALPEQGDDAAHYIAMALASRARVLLEQRDLEGATAALIASLERRPASAASFDGLGLTAVETGKMIAARAGEAGNTTLVESIQAALAKLAPELLVPPPSDVPRGQRRR